MFAVERDVFSRLDVISGVVHDRSPIVSRINIVRFTTGRWFFCEEKCNKKPLMESFHNCAGENKRKFKIRARNKLGGKINIDTRRYLFVPI